MNTPKKMRRRKRPLAEINMVPLIDVMLVLLVIFMITAPLLNQGVQVQLPQALAKSVAPPPQPPIIVSVNQQGQNFLNIADQPMQPIQAHAMQVRVAAALALAKQNKQARPVYVKGDQNTPYGKVVAAMALLQQAGANEVSLVTTPASEA